MFAGKLTVYLGRRDFVDHVTETDPVNGTKNGKKTYFLSKFKFKTQVDGVLLVDKDYLAGRQVNIKIVLFCSIFFSLKDLVPIKVNAVFNYIESGEKL